MLLGEREVVVDAGGDKNITKVMEALKLDFKVLKVRIGNRILSGNVTGLHEC